MICLQKAITLNVRSREALFVQIDINILKLGNDYNDNNSSDYNHNDDNGDSNYNNDVNND